ncbi:MAG: polymer-forming cytoskeletal protein [Terriglobia bacterium]
MAGKWLGNKTAGEGKEWSGFLDRGVKLEGTLEVAGAFRIDGEVKGKVVCQEQLIVGETGRVEGEVAAALLSVAGHVEGTVTGRTRIEIVASGVVEGELHTPCLVIEAGGVIEGRCHMRAEKQPAEAKAGKPLSFAVQSSSSD